MKLPDKFEEKMQALLGDEFPEYLSCYDEPRYYGLRVNTNKISVEDFKKICPFEITPIPWIENGFYYDGDKVTPSRHPYYFAGLYYLQEPSAMTPANRLPVEPGDKVLDVCAAPGGKATELGAKLKGEGVQQFQSKRIAKKYRSIWYWQCSGAERRAWKAGRLFCGIF